MKEMAVTRGGIDPVTLGLGILAALFVFVVLTGRKLPLITSDRAAIVALIVIGLAICSREGIGRVAEIGAWAHPLSILGYLIGATILVIGFLALIGKPVPFVSGYHQAFIVVTMLAVSKVLISTLHRLIS